MLYIPIPTTYFSALNRFVPLSATNHAVIPGHSILMPETQAMDPHNAHQMSQGVDKKSKQPEVGSKPGQQELKVNTLLWSGKARFYHKAVEVCYIYLSLIQRHIFFSSANPGIGGISLGTIHQCRYQQA